MRPTLSLREPQDAPRVKEAKEIVAAALGALDPSVVPFAMRLAEARDAWSNSKRKSSW
jgi:chorismate synthase